MQSNGFSIALPCLLAMIVLASHAVASSLSVQMPRCEGRIDPLGVDHAKPQLGWQLEATDAAARGLQQSAYQVLVSSTPQGLAKDQGDLWDSGKVASPAVNGVEYAGRPLASSQQVFWKVRVWDQSDAASDWGKPSRWVIGVLSPQDWRANWVASPAAEAGTMKSVEPNSPASLLLRREFDVKPGLERATVHVSGLGEYEMTLNGAKVGDELLTPGWTDYRDTVLYNTFDVTALLKDGANAAGITLGNGMYHVDKTRERYNKFTGSFGPQKAIAQIELEYADGTSERVTTDGEWRVHAGPITYTNVYGGEEVDARLEPKGWDRPRFSDADWKGASVIDGPGGRLKSLSAANPPIKTFEVFKPVSSREIRPGVTVYDMGQNASVMPRITVKGPAGSTVRIVPGELMKADGSANQSSGGGPSFWKYTLAGLGNETYFPKFFFRGSRYQQVELTAPPGGSELPVVESIESVVVHADSPPAGTFTSSNELFNRTWLLVRWAQRSNMFSVLTDCPHREKLGWLEEDHLNGPALRYNFDLGVLFAKAMNDMADSQLESGLVPNIAPEYVKFGGDGDRDAFRNSPEWGSAYLLVAWQQYLFDGDVDLLRRHYDGMKRYVAYLDGRANGHILDFGLGDWYDIGPKHPGVSQLTPKALTATAIYFEDVTVLAKTARLLGKEDEAKQFEARAADIRTAFNAKFFNASTRTYATNSQTANAMPLVVGIVEPANRQAVVEAIVKDVRDRGNGLTSGDVGYRYLLRALADNGRSEVIFDMNNGSDRPGYGMQLKRGATSLTEAWDANPSSSQNHFMLGQINEWFFHDLAGIRPDPTAPGFAKVVIRPAVVGDLKWVDATYVSVRGPIRSAWKVDGEKTTYEVTIPPGTTGKVLLKADDVKRVNEGGKSLVEAKGVTRVEQVEGDVACEMGSGTYRFEVRR